MNVIKVLVFNPFQVNTYLLADDTGACAIIDPGCFDPVEQASLREHIKANSLNPVACINTHTHIDHVLGNDFVFKTYGLKPIIHPQGVDFLKNLGEYGRMFGLDVDQTITPLNFVNEGDSVAYGNLSLEILYTPGHADGSICLVNHKNRFVITGDVLFSASIGRTDLPTGSLPVLEHSIRTKLFALPNDYVVYPGHGPATNIGREKDTNPYVGLLR